MKHQKVTTYEKITDDEVKITQESYYDKLSHVLQEIEKQHVSTVDTIREDIDKMISKVLTGESLKSTITLQKGPKGYKVIERITLYKEKLN